MQVLENCDVFTGTEFVADAAVVVDGQYIAAVGKREELPRHFGEAERVDLGGGTISAGYIDLQVNGGGGVLFNEEPNASGLESIVQAHRRLGTTSIAPTFITGSPSSMASALETIEQAVCTSSAVVALHFEGPAISSARLGVHDGAYRSDTFPVGLIPPGASAPVIVTVAPEVVGQHGVAELSRKGVKVALGHSNATLGEFEAGVEAGGRLVTHLYNAMRPFSGRDPGIIGGALTDDRVWVDVIPDGFHVDFASVRLAWKAKPKGRCFFVTDAMPPVGSTMSSYRLGDLEIFYNGDCCVTKDGVIAGSGLNLARGVKNAVARVGIPKDEALKMASLYPAEYLGIADRLGRVRTGCLANLVVIDNECNVMRVYFEGMEIDDSGRAA